MTENSTLSDINVNNVYIYVGDAVRWDHLSASIDEQGLTVKGVSASTHSPPSFASLLTGKYPPNHGIRSFDTQLSEADKSLLSLPDYDTRFLNSIFAFAQRKHDSGTDPIYSVLNITPSDVTEPFEEIEEPFVVMERGPGGHAPYGDFDGTATEYFRQRRTASTETIRRDYRRSVEMDAELFTQRLSWLADNNLAENTLVIYTSDHGELLGEGGELGHSSPMRPELVYVPTVFIHPELPASSPDDTVVHHTDITATALDLLDANPDVAAELDGSSVADSFSNSPSPSFLHNALLPDWVPLLSGTLEYEGAWDFGGGYVSVRSPLHERLPVLAGKLVTSSRHRFILRHFRAAFGAYWNGGTQTYGKPSFSEQEAETLLDESRRMDADSDTVRLSDEAEQQLRDLGYR